MDMGNSEDKQRTEQNLKDAGCDEATIEKFFTLQEANLPHEQLRLLAMHRASLLDMLHSSQHRIDCLDYLVWSIKNK